MMITDLKDKKKVNFSAFSFRVQVHLSGLIYESTSVYRSENYY